MSYVSCPGCGYGFPEPSNADTVSCPKCNSTWRSSHASRNETRNHSQHVSAPAQVSRESKISPFRFVPLLVFGVGLVISVFLGVRPDAPQGSFFFLFGLFSYLALMGWLGRLVTVSERKDLGMLLSFILGPIGVIVAALLRNDR